MQGSGIAVGLDKVETEKLMVLVRQEVDAWLWEQDYCII